REAIRQLIRRVIEVLKLGDLSLGQCGTRTKTHLIVNDSGTAKFKKKTGTIRISFSTECRDNGLIERAVLQANTSTAGPSDAWKDGKASVAISAKGARRRGGASSASEMRGEGATSRPAEKCDGGGKVAEAGEGQGGATATARRAPKTWLGNIGARQPKNGVRELGGERNGGGLDRETSQRKGPKLRAPGAMVRAPAMVRALAEASRLRRFGPSEGATAEASKAVTARQWC
ncbi:MAG: hypothetical protein BJ554DRAFT_5781, partial [Olpidium bornovanus]